MNRRQFCKIASLAAAAVGLNPIEASGLAPSAPHRSFRRSRSPTEGLLRRVVSRFSGANVTSTSSRSSSTTPIQAPVQTSPQARRLYSGPVKNARPDSARDSGDDMLVGKCRESVCQRPAQFNDNNLMPRRDPPGHCPRRPRGHLKNISSCYEKISYPRSSRCPLRFYPRHDFMWRQPV